MLCAMELDGYSTDISNAALCNRCLYYLLSIRTLQMNHKAHVFSLQDVHSNRSLVLIDHIEFVL